MQNMVKSEKENTNSVPDSVGLIFSIQIFQQIVKLAKKKLTKKEKIKTNLKQAYFFVLEAVL